MQCVTVLLHLLSGQSFLYPIAAPPSTLVRMAAKGFGVAKPAARKEGTRQPDGAAACGCGSGAAYAACCGAFHAGTATVMTPEQVLRSRFTAYKYRLPGYLVESTLKFAQATGPAAVADAVLTNQKAQQRAAVKAEKEELLQFIDSYDFSDLEVPPRFGVWP